MDQNAIVFGAGAIGAVLAVIVAIEWIIFPFYALKYLKQIRDAAKNPLQKKKGALSETMIGYAAHNIAAGQFIQSSDLVDLKDV